MFGTLAASVQAEVKNDSVLETRVTAIHAVRADIRRRGEVCAWKILAILVIAAAKCFASAMIFSGAPLLLIIVGATIAAGAMIRRTIRKDSALLEQLRRDLDHLKSAPDGERAFRLAQRLEPIGTE